MIADTHVHTRFSCDSHARMEDYCKKALEKGVGCLCFTDHVDFNPHDCGYGFFNEAEYFWEFFRLKQRYGSLITLLLGVEFSEPHLYPDEFAAFAQKPYDFIIGSIHYWHKDLFPSEMLKAGVPAKECFDGYWKEALRAARAGGFDSFGHPDFPKRYYRELHFDPGLVRELFQTMILNGILPEINTSSLRKGLDSCLPDRELLEIYARCGGKFVTLGSDAHAADDLAAGFERARSLIGEFGLTEAVFIGRRMEAAEPS